MKVREKEGKAEEDKERGKGRNSEGGEEMRA